jgi:hypothetical protein
VQVQSSALDGDLGWAFGARRAQPGQFFNTQDLKGNYDPRFQDVQGTLTYRFSDRVSVEALGIWADHVFKFEPKERTTYFGVISLRDREQPDFKARRANFNGERRDGYTTKLGGVRLNTDLSDQLRLEHDVAYFGTRETENFDVTSQGTVCQVDPSGGANSENCLSLLQTERIRRADNAVEVRRLTGSGHYEWAVGRQLLKGGWSARDMNFDDRLSEKNILRGEESDQTAFRTVVDSLEDQARFDEMQAGFYLQDAVDVLPERDRLLVTGGVRADYYSFNDEWTVSPRLSARFLYNDRLTLNGSWGIYHQQPTYRELRGTPTDTLGISDLLNRDLQSQRSMQFVLGGEYFFPENRLYLRAEAYYKDLDNIISYTIEDVRVNYSGENDTYGYTYGFDFQLRGEFVPGLDSWFNYSFMMARERFKQPFVEEGYNDRGWLPRPTDQRHTFSAFVQDYVPGDKTWKVHLRLLYGSGLPYTTTNPGPKINEEVQTRVPGPRMRGRLPAYRRVDLGATKEIELAEEGISEPVTLDLTLEVLNLFDMDNTVAYTWTGTGNDITRIPKRLTPRALNARLRLTF